jgi:hypothetical protein
MASRVVDVEREESLDRYRRAVEGCLGDRLSLAEEDDYRVFFDHVTASFDRGVDAAACAQGWHDELSRSRP